MQLEESINLYLLAKFNSYIHLSAWEINICKQKYSTPSLLLPSLQSTWPLTTCDYFSTHHNHFFFQVGHWTTTLYPVASSCWRHSITLHSSWNTLISSLKSCSVSKIRSVLKFQWIPSPTGFLYGWRGERYKGKKQLLQAPVKKHVKKHEKTCETRKKNVCSLSVSFIRTGQHFRVYRITLKQYWRICWSTKLFWFIPDWHCQEFC